VFFPDVVEKFFNLGDDRHIAEVFVGGRSANAQQAAGVAITQPDSSKRGAGLWVRRGAVSRNLNSEPTCGTPVPSSRSRAPYCHHQHHHTIHKL
jgi:hypothetical protein